MNSVFVNKYKKITIIIIIYLPRVTEKAVTTSKMKGDSRARSEWSNIRVTL